jgi:sulfite exporter TauE/SafE
VSSVNLWTVFATGLVSGGASCAAVQGGLLAGAVARRRSGGASSGESGISEDARAEDPEGTRRRAVAGHREAQRVELDPVAGTLAVDVEPWPGPSDSGPRDDLLDHATASTERRGLSQAIADDAAPVGGFLAGKLVSHVAFGALLGLFGQALQPSFRVRSTMQIGAGLLMIVMAASLSGLLGKAWFRPSAPKALQRLVRRSARAESAFAPAVLGFLTVLVPCGITLSIEFLVISAGNPFTGAVAMGLFVLGTSPLFALVGYASRRATTVLRGHLTKVAALAVAVAGLLSINSGLALRGSAFTLAKVAPGISAAVPPAFGGGRAATEGLRGKPSDTEKPLPVATVGADGIQVVEIHVSYGEMAGGATPYEPTVVQAKAGLPTHLKLVATNSLGCAGVVVVQGRGIEKVLTANTETIIDLGVLSPGAVGFTCGTGMYGGAINVVGD